MENNNKISFLIQVDLNKNYQCILPHCPNSKESKFHIYRIHNKSKVLEERWKKIVKEAPVNISRSPRLNEGFCSFHFDPKSFQITEGSQLKFSIEANPTQFLDVKDATILEFCVDTVPQEVDKNNVKHGEYFQVDIEDNNLHDMPELEPEEDPPRDMPDLLNEDELFQNVQVGDLIAKNCDLTNEQTDNAWDQLYEEPDYAFF